MLSLLVIDNKIIDYTLHTFAGTLKYPITFKTRIGSFLHEFIRKNVLYKITKHKIDVTSCMRTNRLVITFVCPLFAIFRRCLALIEKILDSI